MTTLVRLAGGVEGEVESFADCVLGLVAPRAYAPGAPVSLEVLHASSTLSLSGRTVGSKRRDDGRFSVRIRLTNLRRAEREALEGLSAG